MALRTREVLAVCLCLVVFGLLAASVHARQAPADPSTALLAEVRAIRTEIRDAATNSMRAQLLVARLSLQEQRITSLSRELADVQTNLTKASAERAEVDQRLREMEQVAEDTTAPQEMQREASAARPVLKRILEQHQQTEQQIRLRETEIMSVITSEQARWTDFNSRLDELERSLIASRR